MYTSAINENIENYSDGSKMFGETIQHSTLVVQLDYTMHE